MKTVIGWLVPLVLAAGCCKPIVYVNASGAGDPVGVASAPGIRDGIAISVEGVEVTPAPTSEIRGVFYQIRKRGRKPSVESYLGIINTGREIPHGAKVVVNGCWEWKPSEAGGAFPVGVMVIVPMTSLRYTCKDSPRPDVRCIAPVSVRLVEPTEEEEEDAGTPDGDDGEGIEIGGFPVLPADFDPKCRK